MNKTKYMAIDDLQQDLVLEEGMEEYWYLGVKITANGKQNKEIKSRINLVNMAISALNEILLDKQITGFMSKTSNIKTSGEK